MATSNNPLAPDPETKIDILPPVPHPPQEDLSAPVPIGESEDEGFIVHEEDREYTPPDSSRP